MKTLLLALVVVAFVCLEPVYPIVCFQCDRKSLWKCSKPKECRPGQNKCYVFYDNDGGKWAEKGCAYDCPTPGPDQHVKCCLISECNKY